MRTEILYSVASARAMGNELIEFVFQADGGKSEKNTLLIYRAPPGRSQAILDAAFCENRPKPMRFVIFSCHFRDFFRYVISRFFAP